MEAEEITFIEHKEITTAEEWKEVTKDVESDDHDNTYRLQLQYCNRNQNQYCPDKGYLMVSDQGEVCSNGDKNDPRTLFEVIHDFTSDRYFMVCKGGKCENYILYMTGTDLKTKNLKKVDFNGTDTSIYFSFKSRGDLERPPWKIQSFSGIPLQFDTEGKFFFEPPGLDHTDYTDPYYFYTYRAFTSRYSAV